MSNKKDVEVQVAEMLEGHLKVVTDNIETRYNQELRADIDNGTITGTAIVFNTESNLIGGQFNEIIKPSAATEEFLRGQDIVMKFNHLPDSILARYRPDGERNSLRFNVDQRGVHFSFKPKVKDRGLLESIKDGDLSSASFSFRLSGEPNSESWERRNDGTILRTITKFDAVKDFSLVIDPAYSDAEVSTRGLDEFKEGEELDKVKAEEKRVQENEEKELMVKELENYYKKYDNILDTLKK